MWVCLMRGVYLFMNLCVGSVCNWVYRVGVVSIVDSVGKN